MLVSTNDGSAMLARLHTAVSLEVDTYMISTQRLEDLIIPMFF